MDVQLFETETNLCAVENVDRRRGWIDMHSVRCGERNGVKAVDSVRMPACPIEY
jgi:hypothetical protein